VWEDLVGRAERRLSRNRAIVGPSNFPKPERKVRADRRLVVLCHLDLLKNEREIRASKLDGHVWSPPALKLSRSRMQQPGREDRAFSICMPLGVVDVTCCCEFTCELQTRFVARVSHLRSRACLIGILVNRQMIASLP
jgi:hypothetical protein